MERQRFYTDSLIVHDDKNWICIVADGSTAVFARHWLFIDKENDIVGRTDYENLFVVSNNIDSGDGFEYTKVK